MLLCTSPCRLPRSSSRGVSSQPPNRSHAETVPAVVTHVTDSSALAAPRSQPNAALAGLSSQGRRNSRLWKLCGKPQMKRRLSAGGAEGITLLEAFVAEVWSREEQSAAPRAALCVQLPGGARLARCCRAPHPAHKAVPASRAPLQL